MPKPTRHYSRKQEKRVATELSGKTTANSGATPFSKGDILSTDCCIECKTLTKPQKTHSIKKEWLDTIQNEKMSMGKRFGIVVFDFGTQKASDQYVILKMSDFKELMKTYEDIEE